MIGGSASNALFAILCRLTSHGRYSDSQKQICILDWEIKRLDQFDRFPLRSKFRVRFVPLIELGVSAGKPAPAHSVAGRAHHQDDRR